MLGCDAYGVARNGLYRARAPPRLLVPNGARGIAIIGCATTMRAAHFSRRAQLRRVPHKHAWPGHEMPQFQRCEWCSTSLFPGILNCKRFSVWVWSWHPRCTSYIILPNSHGCYKIPNIFIWAADRAATNVSCASQYMWLLPQWCGTAWLQRFLVKLRAPARVHGHGWCYQKLLNRLLHFMAGGWNRCMRHRHSSCSTLPSVRNFLRWRRTFGAHNRAFQWLCTMRQLRNHKSMLGTHCQ